MKRTIILIVLIVVLVLATSQAFPAEPTWHKIAQSGVTVPNLLLADFNGDRKADVFHANGKNWLVSYGGTGRWQTINTSAARIDSLALADFNGDGKADVFHGTGRNWLVSYGGTGRWQTINKSSLRVSDLAFGDFNGDKKADVFRADSRNWFVRYGGTGSWQTINRSAARVKDMALADFNGDRKADVFLGDGQNWRVSYGGTGRWQTINTAPSRASELAFADFNGDGKADMFSTWNGQWYVSYGGAIRDLTKVPASNIQIRDSWRGSLEEAKNCAKELREDPRNRELILEIETLLQSAEKTMIRAEQVINSTDVNENERNLVLMELNACSAEIERKRGELRYDQQGMATTAFENFDQKANQLYNLMASVIMALNEMRVGTVRNML